MIINLRVFNTQNERLDNVYNHLQSLRIKGVVQKKSLSIPCRVRLYEKLSGRLIEDISTDEFGNYEFKNLNNLIFFLIAHDPYSQFNAVIQDNVVPK